MKKDEIMRIVFGAVFCCIAAVVLVVLKRYYIAILPVIAGLIAYWDYTKMRRLRLNQEEEERKAQASARRLLDEGKDRFPLNSLVIQALESLGTENPDYFKSESELRSARESDGFNVKRYLFSSMPAALGVYTDPEFGLQIKVLVDGKAIGSIPPNKVAAVKEAIDAGTIQSVEVEISGGPCKYFGEISYQNMKYVEDYKAFITITLKE